MDITRKARMLNALISSYSSTIETRSPSVCSSQSNASSQMSEKEKINLLSLVSLNEISGILKREISFITDISKADYTRIINYKMKRDAVTLHVVHHPISISQDFEYGWQDSKLCEGGRLYYLLSFSFMMIDIDRSPGESEASTISSVCKLADDLSLTVRIYRTYAGVHVFVTSHLLFYRDDSTAAMMEMFGCDPLYLLFSRRCGFKTRLNRKAGRENDIIGRFVTVHGKERELPEIVSYISLHDKLIEWHTSSPTPHSQRLHPLFSSHVSSV